MRLATATIIPAVIKLHSGQCCQLWCGRDAVLVMQSGAVQLRQAPIWISDTMLDLQTDLQEGQQHALERNGWTHMLAMQDSEIWHYSAPPATTPLIRLISRITIAATRYLRRCASQLREIR
jgi:hypothetical protein